MGKYVSELIELSQLIKKIALGDVMTKPAITVYEDDNFSKVEEIFVSQGMHHLPVVNQKKEIVGVISQRDVYRHIAPRRTLDGQIIYRKDIIVDEDGYYEKESLNKYILNYVMRKDPFVLTEKDSLARALNLMVRQKIGCVPIVDSNRHVVGIITRFDILKLLDASYA